MPQMQTSAARGCGEDVLPQPLSCALFAVQSLQGFCRYHELPPSCTKLSPSLLRVRDPSGLTLLPSLEQHHGLTEELALQMELWTCLPCTFPVLGVSLPQAVTCGVPARAAHVPEALLVPVLCLLPRCRAQATPEQEASIQETQSLIKERQNVFFEMEAYLPKKNG